jgi:hypothetical protein
MTATFRRGPSIADERGDRVDEQVDPSRVAELSCAIAHPVADPWSWRPTSQPDASSRKPSPPGRFDVRIGSPVAASVGII